MNWSHRLHQAANSGDSAALQDLLEQGCPPDTTGGHMSWLRGASEMNTRTPLHYASKMAHLECVRLLLRFGGNPNTRDSDGYTPLHYICQVHNPRGEEARTVHQCLLSLLDFGGDPRARTNSNKTPLDIARQQRNGVCERALVQRAEQLQPLLVLSRQVVSALIHNRTLQPVHKLWIPESLKRYLLFQDILLKWATNK